VAEPMRVESCSPLAFAKPVLELVFFRTAWAVAATSEHGTGEQREPPAMHMVCMGFASAASARWRSGVVKIWEWMRAKVMADGAEHTVVCVAVAVDCGTRPAVAVDIRARCEAAVEARCGRVVDAGRSAAAAVRAARGRGGGDERDEEDLDHLHL
jgi:hypothetical protein